MEKQEIGFTRWLNFVLTPQLENEMEDTLPQGENTAAGYRMTPYQCAFPKSGFNDMGELIVQCALI